MRLYEFPQQFRAWERALDESGGEVTPDLDAALDRLHADLADKVDALCGLIREQDRAAEAFRAEARAMADKGRARENVAERLRQYLIRHLHAVGVEGVDGRRFAAAVVKNSSPSVAWPEESGPIPDGYAIVTTRLDTQAVHDAIRRGALPEGFRVVHGEHLRIR